MKTKLFTLIFLITTSIAYSQPGTLTGIQVSQRTDGSGFVDVYFNLSGPASAYNIAMKASFNGGSTYTPIPPAFLSGDIADIAPGSNKHIVWDGMGSFPNTFSTHTRTSIEATPTASHGNLMDELVSYWKFDEGSGITAYDSYGNNHATINGATWVANGKLSNALYYNGVNNSATVGLFEEIGLQDYTYSTWIKTTGTCPVNSFIAGTRQIHPPYIQFSIFIADQVQTGNGMSKKANVFNYGGIIPYNANLKSYADVVTGEWVHLVAVRTMHNTKIFINGELDNEFTTSAIVNIYGEYPFFFGFDGVSRFFNGIIDEVGIWRRALSSEEILLLYNNGNGIQYPFSY